MASGSKAFLSLAIPTAAIWTSLFGDGAWAAIPANTGSSLGWRSVTIFCTSAESAAVRGFPSWRSNTRIAPTALCCGKASVCRLAARIDSYLLGRNSDWSLVALSLGAVAMMTTETTIQPRMTNHGCRVASRPSPLNTPRDYPEG